MSAVLRHGNHQGRCLWKVLLEVSPGDEECHHLGQTGDFPLVVNSLTHQNIPSWVHIKHTPGVSCDIRCRYVVLYLSDSPQDDLFNWLFCLLSFLFILFFLLKGLLNGNFSLSWLPHFQVAVFVSVKSVICRVHSVLFTIVIWRWVLRNNLA